MLKQDLKSQLPLDIMNHRKMDIFIPIAEGFRSPPKDS